ncbi:hypothetical protein MIND_00607900 [Mycena indigotica]|uniref:N-acetylglucosaminylphosphatidylinositol deacetylase n=1 Tax=Mycena indigotica TaxID=2126181 RepID=A0A8H6W6U5_9AGAR|nr:uncharacterized protein MIND_00607900 [Mycena indigotica]KAF7303783.1 hypothetical protein MIND_00607900 [Mycena indigotica]
MVLRTLTLIVALLAAFLHLPIRSKDSVSEQLQSPSFLGNILLLTAHPDDECMFFAPTILALTSLQQKYSKDSEPRSGLFSLCLSSGNADGLGSVRKRELNNSLDVLGIDSDKRLLVDHPDLQDNFTAQWDAFTIATVLKPYILENRISTILTFDTEGVSGHPNHKSIFEGVEQLRLSLREIRFFTLKTTPLLVKYTGILGPTITKFDLGANALFNDFEAWATRGLLTMGVDLSLFATRELPPQMPVFVSGLKEYWTAVKAMRKHSSQLVWFRWLYIVFSRYMWVNEWEEVSVL